jgi:methylmalonyl-CoA/ethylmalonyl-CoA epimerase
MNDSGEGTQAAVRFNRIGQIAITVGDLTRAKDFYQNVLGMKSLFDAGHSSFFQCGDVRLMISATDNPGPRGGTILYFKVDDIHATYASLKEQKIELLQEPHLVAKMPDHDLWITFLKDPDKNTIGVMCEMPNGCEA